MKIYLYRKLKICSKERERERERGRGHVEQINERMSTVMTGWNFVQTILIAHMC